MGILIKITKYHESDNVFYYKIEGEDYPGAIFYMEIDMNKKKLTFYNSLETKNIMNSIDLITLDGNFKTIPGIATAATQAHVFVKAYKAFQKNEFPEHLDYCA